MVIFYGLVFFKIANVFLVGSRPVVIQPITCSNFTLYPASNPEMKIGRLSGTKNATAINFRHGSMHKH
jgi:hypothetical protein